MQKQVKTILFKWHSSSSSHIYDWGKGFHSQVDPARFSKNINFPSGMKSIGHRQTYNNYKKRVWMGWINHISSPTAETDSRKRQPHLLSNWFRVRLVDGQDFCEKCRFQRASTQRSPAAHSPADWSVCSVTAVQCGHGASTVQGRSIEISDFVSMLLTKFPLSLSSSYLTLATLCRSTT